MRGQPAQHRRVEIHRVPGSTAFVEAVRLGLGWGMVPDLQTTAGDGLVELDPKGAIDVALHWQQWRLGWALLERVGAAVQAEAALLLGPGGA